MKTFLIVLAILILLGIVIFLLIRKPEKVIDDDSIINPGSDYDIDKNFAEERHKPDTPADACLQEGTDYSKKSEEVEEEEVHIPEHCKIPKDTYEDLPNKYFFNVHEYVSKKGKQMFCVVCSAVIKCKNYKIVVKNSYYPYLGSYTFKLADKIKSMFKNDKMSIEEFMKLGSSNFNNVGKIVEDFNW